jgi:hypothetical protein
MPGPPVTEDAEFNLDQIRRAAPLARLRALPLRVAVGFGGGGRRTRRDGGAGRSSSLCFLIAIASSANFDRTLNDERSAAVNAGRSGIIS